MLDKSVGDSVRQLIDVAIKQGIESVLCDIKIVDADAVRTGVFGSAQHQVVILERYRQELTSQARNAWSHMKGAISAHDANSCDLKAVLFELIAHVRDTLRNSGVGWNERRRIPPFS